jgi:hypothetical protein
MWIIEVNSWRIVHHRVGPNPDVPFRDLDGLHVILGVTNAQAFSQTCQP